MTRRQAWSGWGRPMQRVAGWDFDHRLNGYITTAADRFSCDCGEEFNTPSGYRKCGSCGRAWNSYVIGTDNHGREASLEKVICREIPVRKDVIVASKRRRTAESDCTCWDGYERVPGTKPCAKGSCRKKAALRYVAWCRQVGRRPSPAGMRRFRTAERLVRIATTPVPEGQHDLDVGNIDQQVNPYSGEGGSPSQIEPVLDGFGTIGWRGGSRRRADRHNLRRIDLRDMIEEQPEEDVSIEHFSSRHHAARPLPKWAPQSWRDFDPRAPFDPNRDPYAPTSPAGWMSYQLGMHPYDRPDVMDVDPRSQHDRENQELPFGEQEHPWQGSPTQKYEDRKRNPDYYRSSHRRAELFDITDEGETKKGKGTPPKSSQMRKNPQDWPYRNKNMQWTKRSTARSRRPLG